MKFDTDSTEACDTDPYGGEDSPKAMTSPETPASDLGLADEGRRGPLLRPRGGGRLTPMPTAMTVTWARRCWLMTGAEFRR